MRQEHPILIQLGQSHKAGLLPQSQIVENLRCIAGRPNIKQQLNSQTIICILFSNLLFPQMTSLNLKLLDF